jgi:hypothetical protein
MQTIKLSTKSFWFKYWNFISFTPSEYPQDTCSFKRSLIIKTLLALVFLPMFLIAQVIHKFWKNSPFDGNEWYSLIFGIQFLAWLLGTIIFKEVVSWYLLSALALLAVIVVLGFSIFLVVSKVADYFDNKPKREKPLFIAELYLSWKDKLCSKIEYE